MGLPVKVYRSRTRTRIRSGLFHSFTTTSGTEYTVFIPSISPMYKIHTNSLITKHTSILCTSLYPNQTSHPNAESRFQKQPHCFYFQQHFLKHAPPSGCGFRPKDLTTEDSPSATRRIRRVLVSSVSANQSIRSCYMVAHKYPYL